MRTRSWTNIALLLAVAIVATAIFLLRDGDRLDPAPLTELEPSAITGFEVQYSDNRPELILRGDGESWRILEPVNREARSGRIVRILSFLDDRIDACYQRSEERMTEFGLDAPDLTLVVDGVEIEFGDRTADGRRYVGAGERLCLVDDVAYPLLAGGATEIAVLALLPRGEQPIAIEGPTAHAVDPQARDEWEFIEGEGAGHRWAVRWRSAHLSDFDMDPPDDDHGEIRIELANGQVQRWRIAAEAGEESDLILVPEGADYGLVIARDEAAGLVAPPERVEDGLN